MTEYMMNENNLLTLVLPAYFKRYIDSIYFRRVVTLVLQYDTNNRSKNLDCVSIVTTSFMYPSQELKIYGKLYSHVVSFISNIEYNK